MELKNGSLCMLFHFLGSPELLRLTATHLNCMLYLLKVNSVCVLEEILNR